VEIVKLRTVQMLHHPSSIVHCWSPLSLSSIGLLHQGPLDWTLAQLHHPWKNLSTFCWKLDGKWFEPNYIIHEKIYPHFVENLMENDLKFDFELRLLSMSRRKFVLSFLLSFHFLRKYEEKKKFIICFHWW
jgi:hypothetical protein